MLALGPARLGLVRLRLARLGLVRLRLATTPAAAYRNATIVQISDSTGKINIGVAEPSRRRGC